MLGKIIGIEIISHLLKKKGASKLLDTNFGKYLEASIVMGLSEPTLLRYASDDAITYYQGIINGEYDDTQKARATDMLNNWLKEVQKEIGDNVLKYLVRKIEIASRFVQ